MSAQIRVLVLAPQDSDMARLENELRRAGFQPYLERVPDPPEVARALQTRPWDLIIASGAPPAEHYRQAAAHAQSRGQDLPFIVVLAADELDVVAAVPADADDLIVTTPLARLGGAARRELHHAQTRAALRVAEEKAKAWDARYRALVEQVPAAIHTLDLEGHTLFVSPQIESMLGFPLADWQADADLWRKQLHSADRERVLAELARLGAPEVGSLTIEYRMLDREDNAVWVQDQMVRVPEGGGTGPHLQSVKLDITEHKRAEQALLEATDNLARWVNELERHNREITLLNELGNQLQACVSVDEAYPIIADHARLLFPSERGALYVHSPSRTSVEMVAAWGEAAAGEQVLAPEDCWALRRGRVHVVEDPRSGQVCRHLGAVASSSYLCAPLLAQGEALGILHLQRGRSTTGPLDAPRHSLADSEQRLALTVAELVALALANLRLRETLRIQSNRDPLTGLFNRRYLEETLERELRRAARKERPLGVIMIDLDHFSEFSDEHGHTAGDALLRELGAFLQQHIRGEDVACRQGSETFTLVLPEASLEASLVRAEELKEEFKRAVHARGYEASRGLSLSAGVAVFPEHGATVEDILHAAEAAVNRAKAEGRDRVAGAQQLVEAPVDEHEGGEAGVAASADEAPAIPADMPPRVVVGPLALNCQTFELTVGDRSVRPTPVEFNLLYFLMRNAGRVFTAEQLLQDVWHYPPGTGSQELVRAHIKNLRGKMEPNPRRPIYLKTIGRFGYSIPLETAS